MFDDIENIFGTREAAVAGEAVTLGPLTFHIGESGPRSIAWAGVELVRAVDFPIRDDEWRTVPTRTLEAAAIGGEGEYQYRRTFASKDGSIEGRFVLEASATGRVRSRLELTIMKDVRLCRAGFTILHPIAGLAGEPLTIRQHDGSRTETRFPLMIQPSQPATDIVGMHYAIQGCEADITMDGDVFEMEDQRNWSDASYKTYGKTESFPLAYDVRAGERIDQTLTLDFRGAHSSAGAATRSPLQLTLESLPQAEDFPELAIAMDEDWDESAVPSPLDNLRRLVRIDLREDYQVEGLRGTSLPPIDLELIVADDREELANELQTLRQRLDAISVHPAHVMALPAAYLKSLSAWWHVARRRESGRDHFGSTARLSRSADRGRGAYKFYRVQSLPSRSVDRRLRHPWDDRNCSCRR
ncbi:hypothetical protein PSQ19_10615 [Devosia algicola]|uniref:D-apionate lactonase N-terminal domain-containing protein n=1 Tax=Devosia algicola TaxID=3026418 RepID=A0ABY7YJ60_9HYPH|nr:hypothetical protein [Devosia algicola]WDR01297.1 hypothetical protein PSQ19_10615 [Devosia algicola]